PVELTPTVTGFMAERLLEMLVIGKRDEHLVWQPEKQPELGTQPQPEEPAVSSAVVAPPTDQAALRDRIAEALLDHLSRTADIRTSSSGGELAFMPEVTDAERMRMADAVLAVLPAPADRAAVLREAADRVDNEELPHDYVDMFDNGARWAARLLRRMADETPDTTADTFAGGSYLTAEHDTLGMIAARHGGDRLAWEMANPWVTSSAMVLPAGLRVAIPAQAGLAAGARQDGAPDDAVTELTEAEFHDAAGKALARLGLTYAELEDQARRRDFSSAQARSLWVTIGGAAPAGARQDGEQQ